MPTLGDLIEPGNRLQQGLLQGDLEGQRPGFCKALSLQWAINCQQGDAGSPTDEFQAMKARGPVYFKQLIQSQHAYEDHWFEPGSATNPVMNSRVTQNVVSLMSSGKRGVMPFLQFARTPEDLTIQILELSHQSPQRYRSSLISIRNSSMGHAIAATLERQGGNVWEWSLLDPNIGLMKFPLQQLDDVIDALWRQYKVEYAAAFMVI